MQVLTNSSYHKNNPFKPLEHARRPGRLNARI